MTVATIFKTCQPRADVLKGTLAETDFAADLAQVIAGTGSLEYCDPAWFFANTYPTRGLKNLLTNVCQRLSGTGGEVTSIFRLDTSYGGGKTHGLIALIHAARGMADVSNITEFIDPKILPSGSIRVAAFDGENADPTNGRLMDDSVLAYSPWGEIAYALAGKEGYQRVKKSDESRIAPGAETLRELFGGEPTLILLDELSVYLRKAHHFSGGKAQLTAFLNSLFKAVESTPNAVLVYTLAIGKGGSAVDAYSEENEFIAASMREVESVSARKATLLNPTEEDETVQVLTRRLFKSIDRTKIPEVLDSYRSLWAKNKEHLEETASRSETIEQFKSSYPFHPEILETLTSKTATLGNFQRVRGMLRLLARTISHLWDIQPADATAIHLHHVDPCYEPIRQEIVTRLGQSKYVPAISNDIESSENQTQALAQQIDTKNHSGMPPYTVYISRTILMHTLAFNEPLQGISPERLRYSVLGPRTDISFIEEARKKFIAESAYLDDRPGFPMRFRAEVNLQAIIHREERNVDPSEVRSELNDRIRSIFSGKTFEAILFPGGPFDVPDEAGDGRPKLVVLSRDGVTIGETVESIPEFIKSIYLYKGTGGSALRILRNNLVFIVVDEARKDEMRRKTCRRLALRELKNPKHSVELAEYQHDKVRELEARSEQELALAIQHAYRHILYPSSDRITVDNVNLAHSAINVHSASDQPGEGQEQIVRTLHELNKLRLLGDSPDSPTYVRDRTPLRQGKISTFSLRNEFRCDPGLPILTDDQIFIHGIQHGITNDAYIYQRGDLVFGPGDPDAAIYIDESSVVFTMEHAKKNKIWPRTTVDDAATPSTPVEVRDGQSSDGFGEVGRSIDPGDKPVENALDCFTAEGVLKEALGKVWEQARTAKVKSVDILTIQIFDPPTSFLLLSAIEAVSNTEKTATINCEYKTQQDGLLQLTFEGSIRDAQPVKEFLRLQLNDVVWSDLDVKFKLIFSAGLSMIDDSSEKLTERLTMFAAGAAYVSATAEVKT